MKIFNRTPNHAPATLADTQPALSPLDTWVRDEMASAPRQSPLWKALPRSLRPAFKPCKADVAAERLRKRAADGSGTLDFVDLGLGTFPPGLEEAEVRSIYADGNRLTSLAGAPTSLRLLTVDRNALTSLAGLPPKVEYLFAGHNPLASLQGLSAAAAGMRYLGLYDCRLPSIAALPDMPELTHLLVGDNNLVSLNGVTRYTHLTSLSAGNNAIDELIDLSPLRKLGALSLRKNKITSLDDMGALPNAIILDFCKNPIRSIANLHAADYRNLSFLHVDRRAMPTAPAGLRQAVNSGPNVVH